jgi:hypothetical protein
MGLLYHYIKRIRLGISAISIAAAATTAITTVVAV